MKLDSNTNPNCNSYFVKLTLNFIAIVGGTVLLKVWGSNPNFITSIVEEMSVDQQVIPIILSLLEVNMFMLIIGKILNSFIIVIKICLDREVYLGIFALSILVGLLLIMLPLLGSWFIRYVIPAFPPMI